MKQLIFSTTNSDKLAIANSVCKEYGIGLVQNSFDIDEIQGEDGEKIVRDKANKAYDKIKQPVIVSDDSWDMPGLNGFPGAYMKSINHWLNVKDFINLTKGLKDRRVFLIQYLAYKDSETTKIFCFKNEGTLLRRPRGGGPYANHKIISMGGDGGLSIAEVFDSGISHKHRDTGKIWHEFTQWFIENDNIKS